MHDEVEQRPSGGSRSVSIGSVLVGLLVAALTLAAGAAAVYERPTTWTAHTTLLVSPSASNDSASSASLFELLTQGQVAATYAALLRNEAFGSSVVSAAGVQQPGGVTLTAEVLPDTFLIRITTTARSATDARRLARFAAKGAPAFADSLTRPFELQAVDAHAITTTRTSNATPTVLALIVLIALCLSVLAQQLAFQLFRLRRRRAARKPAATEAPGVTPLQQAQPAPAAAARKPGRRPSAAAVSEDEADAVPAERA